MNNQALIERRQRAMGPAYRLFYENPLHLVRGRGVWLYDNDGNEYLDCYNNVASVGHCHPRVVEALQRQAGRLNTHTRYLHENIVDYAERLAATLPGDLSVCMFTCTGTEANELAYRMAKTVTGNSGVVVMEDAYHGNSSRVFDMSTEDYPANERPDDLAAVEAPNPYRDGLDEGDKDTARHYAGLVGEAIETLKKRGYDPAMFICDNIFSSNGILTPPHEYFQDVYQRVRAAGALVVADEVQSGLCRLGEHTWAFEGFGVIPDIVTMGKPLGDGHPLAAIVTTPEIAGQFSRKYHYFNTFGGNPVSAAVGLAVLDVIEAEGILTNVQHVGKYLGSCLQELAAEHGLIGDIRGQGLYYGVELVCDRQSKRPATTAAGTVREDLRNNGVLVNTTGPLNNVIKIRPPLVFSKANVDSLLDRLGAALGRARTAQRA